MRLRNWKTTIGGAFAALGTFMVGIPLAMASASFSVPSKLMIWCIFVGLTFQGCGIFFGHLFAVDATTVDEKVDAKIKEYDTTHMTKPS